MRDLSNTKILLTRPQQLATNLTAQIAQHGGVSECLSLFEIQPLLDAHMLRNIQRGLNLCALAIFISRNAAELMMPHIKDQNLVCATIGPSTATILQQAGFKNIIYPAQPPYDSAALLKQLLANDVEWQNRYIMIFTGSEGNTWLAEQLRDRGAAVEVAEVYRRVMSDSAAAGIERIFNSELPLNIALITCVTSLKYLVHFTQNLAIAVQKLPILVVSERIRQEALEMGFLNVYTSKSMSDPDILDALLNWRKTTK